MKDKPTNTAGMKKPGSGGIFLLLAQYKWKLIVLCGLVIFSSGMNLFIPRLVATAIDNFGRGSFSTPLFFTQFLGFIGLIFIATTCQGFFSVYFSEKIAFDLRLKVAQRISQQSYSFINNISAATLLTNLTSDVDAVKTIIAQGVAILFSSVLLILGSSIMLISINWQLAIAVLAVIALLVFIFRMIFGKSAELFRRTQEILDKLNRIINESIIASALIRVVNGQYEEVKKFSVAVGEAKENSLKILALFASLVPLINFLANLSILVVLSFGGYKVTEGTLTIGEFTAFFSYISILITPVIMIGFISNVLVRAFASYGRIQQVLQAPMPAAMGKYQGEFLGNLECKNVSLVLGGKDILKEVSFKIQAGKKTAIIGPTGAGKSQLIALLCGLIEPTSGEILVDGRKVTDYDLDFLRQKMAVVFQDSIIFNSTILENICFKRKVSDEVLSTALETAALKDFIDERSNGLQDVITERGGSLSGGQKQRMALARALVLEPQILLLDDFTARVDLNTEKKILNALDVNYPGLTLVSVSQKIATVQDFDHLILLMEGELLAQGKHEELMKTSFEYRQIYESQQTT